MKIKNITTVKTTKTYFLDLTVADNSNYILKTNSGGLVVHNCGVNVSNIRPKGDYIRNIPASAPGVISEMKMIDAIGDQVRSGGGRRAALLSLLDISHPDTLEFIDVKMDQQVLTNHNISLGITNDFIKAVKKNKPWYFSFNNKKYKLWKFKRINPDGRRKVEEVIVPATDKDYALKVANSFYKVRYDDYFEFVEEYILMAKDLWNKIVDRNLKSGEPGFLFVDNIKKFFNNQYFQTFSAPNPCVVGDTKVTTNYGEITIKECIDKFQNGDEVLILSYNTKTKENEFKKITNGMLTREHTQVITLEIEENGKIRTITCTPDHKIYTRNRSYVKAKNLTDEDDIVVTHDDNIKEQEKSIEKFFYNHITIGSLKSTIINSTKRDVYDITVEENHNFYANNILISNCAELPLPSGGSCCLGSINLAQMYNEETNDVDYSKLKRVIKIAVRFLDNVLTINRYPIPKSQEAAHSGRQIGLGTLGLHYLLIKLGYKYGSKKSLEFIERLYATIRNEAYDASIDLAKEKGAFPKFDAEQYLANNFVKNLPPRVLRRLKKYGIRNVSCLTCAPTGCLVPETKVRTDRGILSMEQLFDRSKVNLKNYRNINNTWILPVEEVNVETIDGLKPITRLYINGKSKTKKITLKSGKVIEGTFNHRIVVKTKNGYVWKRLDELTSDDIVIVKK